MRAKVRRRDVMEAPRDSEPGEAPGPAPEASHKRARPTRSAADSSVSLGLLGDAPTKSESGTEKRVEGPRPADVAPVKGALDAKTAGDATDVPNGKASTTLTAETSSTSATPGPKDEVESTTAEMSKKDTRSLTSNDAPTNDTRTALMAATKVPNASAAPKDEAKSTRVKVPANDLLRLEILLRRQRTCLPRALLELDTWGEKKGHWAWWAFPTEKEGWSEPPVDGMRTCVTRQTAPLLVEQAPEVWKKVLEKLAHLISRSRTQALAPTIPRIDHGRIEYFIRLWKSVKKTPAWLHKVLAVFEKAIKVKKPMRRAQSNPIWRAFFG